MSSTLDKLQKLSQAVKNEFQNDPEELQEMEEFLLSKVNAFPNYFNSVVSMESRIVILKELCDPETYRFRVQKMDDDRRSAHIAATNAINQLNRLCKRYDLEPLFTFEGIGDRELHSVAEIPGNSAKENEAIEDRERAADAIFSFCKEVFLDKKVQEKYNQIENPDRNQRHKETFEMSQSNEQFDKKYNSIEEMINETHRDNKHKNPSIKRECNIEDISK